MLGPFNLRGRTIYAVIILHGVMGILFAILPGMAYYWQLAVIGLGVIDILRTNDKGNAAAVWSAYLAGMEVLLRMTGSSYFWEFGKYGITLFIVLGLLVSNRTYRVPYIIYFVLLLPSVAIGAYIDYAQAREMISFNLSGPLCLAVSCIYFYKRTFTGESILMLIRALMLPLITILAYLTLVTPDLSTISFGSESNFDASGGYGPNQVSLVLGMCIFFIVILIYYGASFSGNRLLDFFLLAEFFFHALLTFSRGGVLGAALAIGAFMTLSVFSRYGNKKFFNSALIIMFVAVSSILIWNYTNALTQNALAFRYAGVNSQTGKPEEYSTGRLLIIQRDIETFKQNPVLGIGPGMSKLIKVEKHLLGIVAHSEWTRLLAEHGLFGIGAILILILAPLFHFGTVPHSARPLLFSIFVLSIFSMFHSAMRLSIIGYFYAWALIIPFNESKGTLRRK